MTAEEVNEWDRELISDDSNAVDLDTPGDGVCENAIQVLHKEAASAVSVDVLLSNLDKVSESRKSSALHKQIHTHCKNLLFRLCVKKNVVVDCKASRLATLCGVSHIIIKHVHSETSVVNANTAYIIHKLTKVSINKIHSEEWFEQMSLPKHCMTRPGGLDNVINMLLDLIRLPLEEKEKFKVVGTQPPRGVLLCGPPGCGKTSLVKYICSVNNIFLVTINGPETFSARPGETESNLRRVFKKAKLMSQESACILFIDEIDSLCPRRGRSGGIPEARATAQFLSLMDGLSEEDNVLVIGASNAPNSLDPALRRPGRLDREVIISPPTLPQRLEILKSQVRNIPLASDIDLHRLAEISNGYVGADLAALCHEAAYIAMAESVAGNSKQISQDHFLSAVKKIRPSLQKGAEGIVDLRPVYWSDIGGLDTVKEQIKQAVEWPLEHPEAFVRMGLTPPKGVLLYGPPGCCKTTLVRAAATTCHSTFLSISGAQLYSPYVGDSERLIAQVFQKARACAPSTLFLDEIDSIVGKRSESGQRGVQERVLATLLNEIDGIGVRLSDGTASSHKQRVLEGQTTNSLTDMQGDIRNVNNNLVLIVAATNRPDLIDEALMRPGRMDRIIYVQHPDLQARKAILSVYTKKMRLLDCDLDLLADCTEMYTGADLESLCREAALCALTEDIKTSTVNLKHFEHALNTVPPSLNKQLVHQYSTIILNSSKGFS